jgi:hypothetical protein
LFSQLTFIELRTQNELVHSLSRVVVLILALGLAVTAYCAEACNMPQVSAPECPLHHHSGSTNCCDHTSDETVMSQSTTLLIIPFQLTGATLLPDWTTSPQRRLDPPEVIVQYPNLALSSVLRV